MTQTSLTPDLSTLEIPMDSWTEPFWAATAEERISFPHCTGCGAYRWPAGPFCPECHQQAVAWTDSGPGRVYSFTIIRRPGSEEVEVPALVEFPEAGGMRLIAAIVDTPVDSIMVGAAVVPGFSAAANGKVPVFRILSEGNA